MLSLLDQLANRSYVSIVLFYSTQGERNSNLLKKSLAATLSHFYPLAGRVSENVSCIDCNDDGAVYVEAEIAGDMSVVLEQSEVEQIVKLLPRNPNEYVSQFSDQEIVAVQVNHFRCGGVAIGVCVSHVIADMSTLATFVQSWSVVVRGDNNVITDVIFDGTTLFPQITSAASDNRGADAISLPPKAVTKRLVFDGCKIAALREKIVTGFDLDSPTRVEAVSVLIWGAFIAAVKERDETIKNHAIGTIVNLRKKVSPPLPQQYIGNICLGTTGNISIQNAPNYGDLARTMREAIRKIDDEYVRKFDVLAERDDFFKMLSNKVELFGAISWCKFPFYGVDFGWGEPIWVGTGQQTNKAAILLDTRDGKGIEAWVTLPEEYMILLEQNPDILEYACFSSIK